MGDVSEVTPRNWLVPNRPSELGRAMGRELARLVENNMERDKERFPNAPDGRCKTCAFRPGTIPNGCEETVMDALKAALQFDRFLCHQTHDENGKPDKICVGWLYACSGSRERMEAPWPYSHEGEDVPTSEYADAAYAMFADPVTSVGDEA